MSDRFGFDVSDWKASVRLAEWGDVIELCLFRRTTGGIQYLTKDWQLKIAEEGGSAADLPKIPREAAQAIVDGFFSFGVSPKARRHQEEIDLVKYHLEDMRKLVFKKP